MSLLFVGLVAAGIFLPFVRLMGPFSADDILPLVGVILLGAVALRRFDLIAAARSRVTLGFLLLGAAAVFSCLVHAESVPDLLRMTGKSTGRMLFYALLVILTGLCCRGSARAALRLFCVVATLEAAFAVATYVAGWSGPYGVGITSFADASHLAGQARAQGTFGAESGDFEVGSYASNFLAAYLLLGILSTSGLVLVARKIGSRIAWSLAAALQLIALLLTYTRASLVALCVGGLVMGWLLNRRRLALGAVTLGVATVLLVPTVRQKFLDGNDRPALYWAAGKIALERPLAGTGEGRYETVLYSDQSYVDTPFGRAGSTAHNSILQSAAQYGLPAGSAHLLLYLLTAGAIVAALRRSRAEGRTVAIGVAAALVALLCQDFFNNLMFVPKVATQAWLLVGLIGPLAEE